MVFRETQLLFLTPPRSADTSYEDVTNGDAETLSDLTGETCRAPAFEANGGLILIGC